MGSPVVEQLAAARLVPRLAAGAAARAADLAGRHDRVRALLADRLPTWRYAAVGGSAAWIELPGADAAVFAQIALRHGVETVPGAATDPGGEHDSFLRFPVTFPDDTLEEAVARLAQAWAIYTAGRSGQATPARPDRPGTSVAVP
jgi:DNA-binding transcriptional MocR family regulator